MAIFETIYFQGSDNGKFNYPWGICTDSLGFIYVCDKENHRIQVSLPLTGASQYLIILCPSHKGEHLFSAQVFQSDGTFVAKFGSMGSKPGQLEHPHYIAVSNTNRVIVSDSNNHRLQVKITDFHHHYISLIQIFDVNGKVLTTFGSEGTEEGQFKFPRFIF